MLGVFRQLTSRWQCEYLKVHQLWVFRSSDFKYNNYGRSVSEIASLESESPGDIAKAASWWQRSQKEEA